MKKKISMIGTMLLVTVISTSLYTNVQAADTRQITDLTGAQVEIPDAEDIDKVMIVAPPLLSTYLSVVQDDTKLVGIHSMCISDMNEELLPMLLPDKDSISEWICLQHRRNIENGSRYHFGLWRCSKRRTGKH